MTDPSEFDENGADPADVVLWEIEATPGTVGSDFEELGYTFSQPAVVKAEGHGWVAVLGNGYDGKSGHAILYFLEIQTGALVQKIDFDCFGRPAQRPLDRRADRPRR